MAQSNSSYTPWDRLYDGIDALESLSQIISTFSTVSPFYGDCVVSLLSYMGDSLRQDRDAYLDHLSANCQEPDSTPLHVLGPMYGDAPVASSEQAAEVANG